jgi:Peptidase C13 family
VSTVLSVTSPWRDLAANLRAGTRLALFMPVNVGGLKVSGAHYALLVVVSFAVWLLGDMAREGFPGGINPGALTTGLAQIPIVLLFCILAAAALREPGHAMRFAVLMVASDPLFEFAAVLTYHLAQWQPVADYAPFINQVFLFWALITLIRVQFVVAGWQPRRSLGAAFLFVLMLALFAFGYPRSELWSAKGDEQASPAEGLIREDLFHLQGQLLDNQLVQLQAQRPGVDDLYFLGAAPYALQDTFVKELAVVRRLMDERFDTAGRSIALANHASTLANVPLATVTNLRAALEYLGETIDVEEDIVFLFLTTHGSANQQLSFEMPPLSLAQLNPTMLSRMLADSGIKWKVVVVSACYSGGFVEALKDDNTLIVTASDASNTSFGCEAGSDFTWFSQAYFDDALRKTRSLFEAFAFARATVSEREKSQGYAPSNPQMHLGAALKVKLDALERRLESSDPGRPAVHAALRLRASR